MTECLIERKSEISHSIIQPFTHSAFNKTMKTISTFLTLIILSLTMNAQSLLSNSLYESYDSYKEKSITDKRITNVDIVKYFSGKKSSENFSFEVAGKSLEGRSIYLVKIGNGATKVMAWSQMHGDEPTATMALLDLFNFFTVIPFRCSTNCLIGKFCIRNKILFGA